MFLYFTNLTKPLNLQIANGQIVSVKHKNLFNISFNELDGIILFNTRFLVVKEFVIDVIMRLSFVKIYDVIFHRVKEYIKFKEFTIKFGKKSNCLYCNMDTIDEKLADETSNFIASEKI